MSIIRKKSDAIIEKIFFTDDILSPSIENLNTKIFNTSPIPNDILDLTIFNNVTNPTYQLDISCGQLIGIDGEDNAFKLKNINKTVDIETYGINGLEDRVSLSGTFTTSSDAVTGVGTSFLTDFVVGDVLYSSSNGDARRIIVITDDFNMTLESAFTVDVSVAESVEKGGEAPNTWYHVWGIFDETNTETFLSVSLSPVLPSGYTYKGYLGAVRNDNTSNFIPFTQTDKEVLYDTVQTIQNGGMSTGSWTGIDVTTHFPTTARKITCVLSSNNAIIGLSPNSDGHGGQYFRYGNSGTTLDFGIFPSARYNWATFEIKYNGTIYYYVNNVNSSIYGIGYSY